MTVSDGAVRSHRTAPTHAVNTHPMPITPHHVISAIATPIGPSPVQPLSNGGKRSPGADRGTVPAIAPPPRPASAGHPKPPPPPPTTPILLSHPHNHPPPLPPTN